MDRTTGYLQADNAKRESEVNAALGESDQVSQRLAMAVGQLMARLEPALRQLPPTNPGRETLAPVSSGPSAPLACKITNIAAGFRIQAEAIEGLLDRLEL